MKEVVLIPAYQPDECLIGLVEALSREGLGILVVDDGSAIHCKPIFDAIRDKAVVIHAPKNGGKGAALKLGMGILRESFPEATHFITADADGQHRVEDILRVRRELQHGAGFVLTMRRLNRHIPLRSKIGNDLSRFIYTLLTGHFFRDNQSGLRGFDVEHIDWLLKVKGEKYDYEMNSLYYADKQHISITTLPIDAIYIDGNKSSHFDPIQDTLRIYRRLFASALGTFAGMGAVEVMILVASVLLHLGVLRETLPGAGFWGLDVNVLYYIIPAAGAMGLAVHLIIDRFVTFRRIRYRDTLRLTVQTVFRFVIYTGCCLLLKFLAPWLDLWVGFNFIALCYIPLEYYTRKLLYISQYQVYTKED